MVVHHATHKAYDTALLRSHCQSTPRGWACTVTCLCPGPTATEFQKRANIAGIRLTKYGVMDARTVAEDGYRGLMAGKPTVISGFRNWLVAQSIRFAPRRMVTAMARKIQESGDR